MARDPKDESQRKHREWLGFIQPVGLVVSPPALVDADCHLDTNIFDKYQRFIDQTAEHASLTHPEPFIVIKDLRAFLLEVLGWKSTDFISGKDAVASELVVPLAEYGETLQATYAVFEDRKAKPPTWSMLIKEEPVGTNLDEKNDDDSKHWQATPQARFERLLREAQVPVGLLFNGRELRLVYAPRGESAGHLTFPVSVMLEVAGRPVFAALFMLLKEDRVFGSTGGKRLADILEDSRKYQNTVSTKLARQVLAALYELLRGFQDADGQAKGKLLADVLAKNPEELYAGQLAVLLRLVFLLYAEDRGLMSESEVYVRHYSVTGLFDKLRADAGRHPDTMDQRYGGWARLVTLFRLVHDGAKAGTFKLPARHGYLFDPDRYPFLEGRPAGSRRDAAERIAPPLVSDGVLFRVLRNLLILDGERLSYRTLDVEQIGSVYEAMMGFTIEVAAGRSIAIKPKKSHGAPASINLDELLEQSGDKRAKWFKDMTDLAASPTESAALKIAKTPEEAFAALNRKIAKEVTPNIVPAGSMVLQPSEERRKSGSHYTPRSLTEPIVRKALEPILKQLGENPTPEQILNLKVCDPAMGSGAFLVEVCRQLAEILVKAWHLHRCLPKIPPDEDEVLHARRMIAQRCLYGVDKNPMAVDLSKLSLWLATLAKDHPFTFLDHSLRSGDSLVGLTREQIVEFHWKDCPQRVIGQDVVEDRIKAATKSRQEILDADEFTSDRLKEQKLALADESLNLVRFAGNLVVAAFFAAEKDKERLSRRDEYLGLLSEYLRTGNMQLRPTKQERALREGDKPIVPFHWEIEFPEVFGRTESGFDCMVGNPPFAGKNTIGDGNRDGFFDWLKVIHEESHGNADLVAHFFRRAFNLLRMGGTFGLIATNTIAQGDTRSSGLRWICTNGGTIYEARRRYRWPGQAAVVVSVVHMAKARLVGPFELDGKPVERITAYLFHAGGHDDPAPLATNAGKSYIGSYVLGMGFTFDDTDKDEVANPICLMHELISKDKRNADRIFRYIGGEEILNDPKQMGHRFVINFGSMSEDEARQWPDLFKIVEEKVKPERLKNNREAYTKNWWQYAEKRLELVNAIQRLNRVLVHPSYSTCIAFTFIPVEYVIAHPQIVMPLPEWTSFCVLQSRLHEVWARFFASSMKDDLRYTPSDCFETFPFPANQTTDLDLEAIGKEYYEFRAALMVTNNEGLTKTYNRFHDPNERSPEIFKLRELHDQMDRAVLAAFGGVFAKLTVPKCEFLLDYEEEDDEEEPGKRQKKKPWRYRWPDTFRDEVLALLLELNKQRAEAEKRAGAGGKGKKKAGKSKAKAEDGERLFGG